MKREGRRKEENMKADFSSDDKHYRTWWIVEVNWIATRLSFNSDLSLLSTPPPLIVDTTGS